MIRRRLRLARWQRVLLALHGGRRQVLARSLFSFGRPLLPLLLLLLLLRQ
jgi:hypothetical protein